ncbi:hypothetical protein STEG23_031193 [Scotinomys teguina]
MKLNISFPATGCQKLIEVNDEHKLHMFYKKHMATEVDNDALGEEWKGYVVQISGGNDKQVFPMKQGVLTHGTVRLLLIFIEGRKQTIEQTEAMKRKQNRQIWRKMTKGNTNRANQGRSIPIQRGFYNENGQIVVNFEYSGGYSKFFYWQTS